MEALYRTKRIMEMAKENYEKVLLALMLVLLSVTSIMSILMIRDIGAPGMPELGKDIIVEDIPKVSVASVSLNIDQNKALDSYVYCRNASCKYLIHKSLFKCNWCGTALVREDVIENDSNKNGINDKVELSWGLKLDDPNEILRDKDGDGFSNKDEYERDVSPIDANMHPPLILRATYEGVVEKFIPFNIKNVVETKDVRGNKRVYVDAVHSKRGSFYLAIGEETSWLKILDAGIEDEKMYAVIRYYSQEFKVWKGVDQQYPGWPKFKIRNNIHEGKAVEVAIGEKFELISSEGQRETYQLKQYNEKNNSLIITIEDLADQFELKNTPFLKEPIK